MITKQTAQLFRGHTAKNDEYARCCAPSKRSRTELIQKGSELSRLCPDHVSDVARPGPASISSSSVPGLRATLQTPLAPGVLRAVRAVWLLRDGSRVEQPFLDMSGEVLSTPWLGDERGFLGMAFHPKYRDNGRFFIYTKAPATSSQVKPTTTSASITTTSTAAPTWKSPEKKARKKNTLKQRRKNKNLNKKGAKAKMKKKSRKKTEVAAVIKPVSDKIKAKANQTDTDKDALKTSNSLSDNTIHTKKKMRKRAQQQIRLEKDSVKMKESAVGYQSFMNKTKTSLNVKSNTTTRNKLQVKRDAKAL